MVISVLDFCFSRSKKKKNRNFFKLFQNLLFVVTEVATGRFSVRNVFFLPGLHVADIG